MSPYFGLCSPLKLNKIHWSFKYDPFGNHSLHAWTATKGHLLTDEGILNSSLEQFEHKSQNLTRLVNMLMISQSKRAPRRYVILMYVWEKKTIVVKIVEAIFRSHTVQGNKKDVLLSWKTDSLITYIITYATKIASHFKHYKHHTWPHSKLVSK